MHFGVLFPILFFFTELNASNIGQGADDVLQLYEEFKKEYGKSFIGDEDHRRFEIFKQNLERAKVYEQAEGETATYGVTQFFDLTPEEFREIYATSMYDNKTFDSSELIQLETVGTLPDQFDWREYHAVGPVRNQGRCGDSWAFSAIGNIEGQWFMKIRRLLSLSQQELLDCDTINHGCGGGSPINAFEAVKQLGGLELADDYPYLGFQEQCELDHRKLVVQVNGSIVIPKDENQIAEYLYKHGPLSVGINVSPLQYYTSGILHPSTSNCDPVELDYSVLAVGFGNEQGVPYWTLKNSWGVKWGEQGYFRLYRGNGTCGINEAAVSVIVA